VCCIEVIDPGFRFSNYPTNMRIFVKHTVLIMKLYRSALHVHAY
jgi:hypothetical protein